MTAMLVTLTFFTLAYFGARALALRLKADPDRLKKFRVIAVKRIVTVLSVAYIVMSKMSVSMYQCHDLGIAGRWLMADCAHPPQQRRRSAAPRASSSPRGPCC